MTKISTSLLLIVLSTALVAQNKSPRMTTVTPDVGKPDQEYVAAGESLASDVVKDLYLTDGKDDIKVVIVTQKEDSIQFKVPGNAKPASYRLMILTADGKRFIEQPVKLTIE